MSSFNNTIRSDNFDKSNLVAKDIVTLKSGMKRISTKYGQSGNGFRTQTPKMQQIFELNEHKQDSTGHTNYSFCLSFRGGDNDKKIGTFQAMVEDIDTFNIEYATTHSKELFGKEIKRDVVEEFYKPCVKYSLKKTAEGEQYPPTMKIKLPFRDGKPYFKVFDKNKEKMELYDSESNEVSLDMFSSNTKMICLLEYTGIWVVSKSFGSSWNLVQAKVYKEEAIEDCVIMDSDDEDEDEDESKGEEVIDDDDADDDADDEDEKDGGEAF